MLSGTNPQEHLDKYRKATNVLRNIGSPKPGSSSYDTVYTDEKLCLQHYHPTVKKKTLKTPLLIVYALVNRHHIADLDEKRSMVRKLLDQGLDIYIIDWGYPDPADRFLDLEDYINGYINASVDHIRQATQCDSINLLGICQGGTFSACYTALYPEKIKNLITMVALFDFHAKGNTLGNMARNINARQAVDALGNIKGNLLNANFSTLNPISLSLIKNINAIDSLQNEESAMFFLRMEDWIEDSPDQAGAALCEFIEKFYQGNQLVKGNLYIGKQQVDLKKITQPVLNVYGQLDHIVPAAASKALKKLCNSSDYSELSPKTGHIGMYVSSKAQEISSQLYQWLSKHDS